MKKLNFLIIIFCITILNVTAQEVKFDDDKVLVDKTVRFNFNRKGLGTEFSLYKLNTKDEIIYMSLDKNETNQYKDDDFKRLVFLQNKITIESSRLKYATWKAIVKLLLEDKVLDLEGNINTSNLEKFYAKYNEVND
jgi:hypothetical protein